MPAHPTTVSLRSDAVPAPTTKTECSGPENATAGVSSILIASAGGRNSQPPRDRRRPEAAGCFHSAASSHTIGTNASS